MYIAAAILCPLILGSLWAYAAAIVVDIIILVSTAFPGKYKSPVADRKAYGLAPCACLVCSPLRPGVVHGVVLPCGGPARAGILPAGEISEPVHGERHPVGPCYSTVVIVIVLVADIAYLPLLLPCPGRSV